MHQYDTDISDAVSLCVIWSQRILFSSLRNFGCNAIVFTTFPRSFEYKSFPAVSSFDLFNLGSFPSFTELYHNLWPKLHPDLTNSAESTRSIQQVVSSICCPYLGRCFLDCRLQGWWGVSGSFLFFLCFLLFSWTSQRTRRVLSRGGLILWKIHKKKGVFVFLNPFLSPSGISEKKVCLLVLHCDCTYC